MDRPSTELRGWRPSDQLPCFIFVETNLARDVRALLDLSRRFPRQPGGNSSPGPRLGLHVSLLLTYQLPEPLMVGPEDVARVDAAKELEFAHEGIEELLKLIRVGCFVPAIRRVLLSGYSSVLRQDRHIGVSVAPGGMGREGWDAVRLRSCRYSHLEHRDLEGRVCRHRVGCRRSRPSADVDQCLGHSSARQRTEEQPQPVPDFWAQTRWYAYGPTSVARPRQSAR